LTAPIDLILLTGFLGSGKTSLLVRYLRSHERAADTAVIVNEAGEINIDAAIIHSQVASLQMAMLSNGCVCCANVGELAVTIEELITARRQLGLEPLRRIIVEASGLSRPGPLLRQVGTVSGYPLRTRVVSTWDCTRSEALLEFDEAHAQVAAASVIILTKQDLVGPGVAEQAKQLARSINPFATLIDESSADETAARAFEAGVEPQDRKTVLAPTLTMNMHPRTLIWNHRFPRRVHWDDMAEWLDNLAGFAGERLLRTKGIIPVLDADHPILVQGVGSTFAAPLPIITMAVPFLVVIARDLTATDIEHITPSLAG
jgi:G3E family GTPase